MKTILILSLIANVLFATSNYYYASSYDRLLVWACEQGNGGFECGEE